MSPVQCHTVQCDSPKNLQDTASLAQSIYELAVECHIRLSPLQSHPTKNFRCRLKPLFHAQVIDQGSAGDGIWLETLRDHPAERSLTAFSYRAPLRRPSTDELLLNTFGADPGVAAARLEENIVGGDGWLEAEKNDPA